MSGFRMNPFTINSLSPSLASWQYQNTYIKWMQKTNHPELAKSNWNADKYRSELKQAAPP